MKSIKTKLRYCLTLLLLGLFSFSTSYAQDVPTDAEVAKLTTSRDAKTLEEYFIAQGYTDGGIIQGSQGAATSTLVTPSSSSGHVAVIQDPTVRSIVVAKVFKNAAGKTVDLTYAADINSDGTSRYEASGDNEANSFFVSGGTIQIVPRDASGNRGFAAKFANCWRLYVGGIVSNCTSCYNCLNSALSGSAPTWLKIIRALRCVGPCFRCISGIVSFVYCVVR